MSRPERAALRRPLTRARILDAAVELVDAAGPDALTMRSVAAALDAGTMSLYRHVSGREELLDLVLERMMAEIPVSPLGGDWRRDLAAIADDVYRGLLRRRHLTVLLTSRLGRGPAALAGLERTLSVLWDAGFDPRTAAFANHALGNLVAGAALWEAVGFGGSAGEDRAAVAVEAATALATLPSDDYPAVRWAGSDLFAGSAADRFRWGVETLIEGLEAWLRP
jgi:AcrR family transcriptional regulator